MKFRSSLGNGRIRAAPLELFLDHMSHMFSLYIHVVIELPQRMDLQILRRAMWFAATKEPVISSRYIRRDGRAYWQVEDDPDWDIEETFTEDDRCGYSPDLITPSPHPENHFPISIRLIHQRHLDKLHIRISHILCDAGGCRKFVYNLADAYRKVLIQPDMIAHPPAYICINTAYLKNREHHGFLKCLIKLRPDLLLSGLWSDKIAFLPTEDYFAIPMNLDTNSDRMLVTLQINASRVAGLKENGKKKNATLNDMLLTAFSRALSNRFHSTETTGKKIGIIVTSDMRRFIGYRDYLGNMSNWGILKVGSLPLSSQSELLEDVVRATSRWKKNLCGLGNFLFNMAFLRCKNDRSIRFIARKLIPAGPAPKACRIVFTNLGLLNRKKIDFGDGPCLNAYMIPPIGNPPLFIAGASGFDGKLCISMGYLAGSMSAETVADITEEIDRELHRLE